MSIEQDLNRIAVALETIAGKMGGAPVGILPLMAEEPLAAEEPKTKRGRPKKVEEPVATPATPPTAPVEPPMAPSGGSDFIPGEETLPGTRLVAPTVQDLREYAQKLAQKAKPNSDAFVTFIKNNVCAKFCPPDQQKLAAVPLENVEEAWQIISDYAEKMSIGL